MTEPIPQDVSTVSPYLLVTNVDQMISFLTEVFGAELDHALTEEESGEKNHAQVRIGDCTIMMGKSPEFQMAGMVHIYVEDVDATYERALAHGATTMMAPEQQFYGDRSAGVSGPFGNAWWIASRTDVYTPKELQERSIEEHRRRKAAKKG